MEVTERDEPQAVIGSTLHELAYPDVDHSRKAERSSNIAHEHPGRDISEPLRHPEILSPGPRRISLRGLRRGRPRVFDIAFIDDKGFQQ